MSTTSNKQRVSRNKNPRHEETSKLSLLIVLVLVQVITLVSALRTPVSISIIAPPHSAGFSSVKPRNQLFRTAATSRLFVVRGDAEDGADSSTRQNSLVHLKTQERETNVAMMNQFAHRRGSCSCYDSFFQTQMPMREARITMPLMALFSSFFSSYISPAAATMVNSYSFDISLKAVFPTALTSKQTADRVIEVLRDRGYTEENTLFGSSICSDEINTSSYKNQCLFTSLAEEFAPEGAFNLGGLAGIPFVGKSGLGAYAHHVPDKDTNAGKLLILYAPHVGISSEGDVGKIRRVGREKLSGACGAGIGAYQAIVAGSNSFSPDFDFEEEYIIQELQKRFKRDQSALDPQVPVDPIVFTTYQVYCMIRDLLYSSVVASGTLDECSEIALLGGIIINQYGAPDYFQPLSFQTIKKVDTKNMYDIQDLYNVTFGEKPVLTDIVGNKESWRDVMSEVIL